MTKRLVFDESHYESLNRSRLDVVSRLISELKGKLNLKTAIDVGCGIGFFSNFLSSVGLEVCGVDGRRQNVEEAQRRLPHIHFQQCDAQDKALCDLGHFDLVFCFGLLYHLENPFLAIRNLQAMTRELLLLEAVIFPGDEPTMALVDEEFHDDQGLNHIAFYPTEACLVKMLYKSKFPFVYRFTSQPAHPDYHASPNSRRVRTMLAASLNDIPAKLLRVVNERSTPIRPWDALSGPQAPEPSRKTLGFARLQSWLKNS